MKYDFSGKTILDIGTNFGVYSYYMSKAADPRGRLFAFEAQPELGIHLDAEKETYRLDNLTVVRQALSSPPGVLKMRRSKIGSGGASFHHEPSTDLDEINVPVITMDEFLSANQHTPISFIKCDVEHHELDALRGGKQALSEYMPALLFECHEGQAEDGELFSYLAGLGYDGFFYFVRPSDHKSVFRNNKDEYRHFSEFKDSPYPRPSVRHRNYISLKKGQHPM